MTCHQNWDGFKHVHDDPNGAFVIGDPIFAADNFHRGAGPDTDCMACHGAIATLDEAYDFHNDFQATDAHYDSFYRGRDISFENPNNVGVQVTGLTKAGDAVTFTWTASKDGAPVDPCNTTLSNTAPTFQALGAYLAYAKGDDWVNEGVGNSPGQPAGARNLFTSLTTTCATNVATTTGLTIDPDANAYADKVVLAIGGKPLDQDSFLLGAVASNQAFYVREPSPTYEFSITDGSAVAARRNAVSNDKCLGCHQGTLYQHGGDRVDNEQLCVICHNPSAADKNNRLDRFQILNADGTVNTDATYDGKNNETYDMRTMLHSIHGVGKRQTPWTIYRSRGIYAFAPAVFESIPDPNDPTETITVEVPYPFPAGWPADGMTINGSTNGSTIAHNWTVVHYPKPINDCMACHNAEAYEAVDQTKAVPLTVDPGSASSGALTNSANYSSQTDDIVIGPTAAACTACHYTAPVRTHATSDFGYKANVTKEEMLEKAANQ
jgi:OmcA/MtrC family decaheme c-type cytochrome